MQLGLIGRPIAIIFEGQWCRAWPIMITILKQAAGAVSLVGRALEVFGALRLSFLVTSPQKYLISREFEDAFKGWATDLGQTIFGDDCLPVILLPPQGLKRGRLYVYHIAGSDQIEGFSKLSLDDDNDARIARERDLLNELSTISNPRLETPKVLDCSTIERHLTCTITPLPNHRIPCASIHELEDAFSLFSGIIRISTVNELIASEWCTALERNLWHDGTVFFTELRSYGAREVQICRAHGDPGPHNFFRVGDKFWIVDWEDSEEHAPILADKFSFRLGTDRDQILKDPSGYLKKFWESEGVGDVLDEMRLDVMLAMAFRASRGHPEALALIRNWLKQ